LKRLLSRSRPPLAAATALAGLTLLILAVWPDRLSDLAWRLDPADPATTLADVERDVTRIYGVADIAVEPLEAALAQGAVVLFDVRTVEEYETGHLPGAIRVDPEITPEAFLARYGGLLRGRPAVFYCAVGVRSSRLMSRLISNVAALSGAEVSNLQGGAFRWVAEGRTLVVGAEPGRLHPYDEDWEQLLKRTLASR
jgi:rhodanese-related sulfurtransferase